MYGAGSIIRINFGDIYDFNVYRKSAKHITKNPRNFLNIQYKSVMCRYLSPHLGQITVGVIHSCSTNPPFPTLTSDKLSSQTIASLPSASPTNQPLNSSYPSNPSLPSPYLTKSLLQTSYPANKLSASSCPTNHTYPIKGSLKTISSKPTQSYNQPSNSTNPLYSGKSSRYMIYLDI